MLTKLQYGEQSRVGQSFAIELQHFMKASGKRKDLKIGVCFIYLLKFRVGLV